MIQSTVAPRLCRLCGERAEAVDAGLVSNGYALMTCRACRGVLVETKPSDDELGELYDGLFSEGAYETHRREFAQLRQGRIPRSSHYRTKLLRRAQRFTSGKSLVEIGGGTGAFSAMVQAEGFHYTNYDISRVAVRCHQELGSNAHWFHPSELPPIPPETADILVMWEVLEHVWAIDDYLHLIRKALRPAGVFIFSTPNFERESYQESLRCGGGSAPPIHINFFTVGSLAALLQRHGFSHSEFMLNRIYRPTRRPAIVWDSVCTALGLRAPITIFGLAR